MLATASETSVISGTTKPSGSETSPFRYISYSAFVVNGDSMKESGMQGGCGCARVPSKIILLAPCWAGTGSQLWEAAVPGNTLQAAVEGRRGFLGLSRNLDR